MGFLTTEIIVTIVVAVILILGWGLFILNRYRKHLVWIRDRCDLTTESGREILTYINRELNDIYGFRRAKEETHTARRDGKGH